MRAKTLMACGAIAMALHLTAGAATAQVTEKKTLTLSGAKAVAAAAAAEARKNWAGGSIAVVDDGGNLLLVERLDNTFAAAANISIAKARSAANFRKETSAFENAVKNGRVALVANQELLPLQGGVPIIVDGQVVGAIGVAGANSAQQDEDIAVAAVKAFSMRDSQASNEPVTQLESKNVEAAFMKGQPLYETEGYKIHASRREGPGMAEVHVRDTDIIYVLSGSATIVTGGTVIAGKTVADDEIRGSSIEGGQPRVLVKGDVMVVPNGVPHRFEKVQAPFLYYVVKATAPAGGDR
jgi:glc operon protein GlcG